MHRRALVLLLQLFGHTHADAAAVLLLHCFAGQRYLVRASYLEIYQENVRDLLSKSKDQKLELKDKPDSGVYVKDLSSFVVKSTKEIEHVMYVGNKNRKTGSTKMNATSSRSHAIFIITVRLTSLYAQPLHPLSSKKGNVYVTLCPCTRGKTSLAI